MSNKINANQTGLALAGLMVIWHVFWSVLVITGLGQAFLDFVYWAHYLSNPFVVGPFVLARALCLITIVAIAGYLFGCMFAWFWNQIHKR